MLVVLSSCESMEESRRQNCKEQNWQTDGFSHASNGQKPDTHEAQYCAPYVGDKAKAQYLDGYASGLQKFCTYEYGLYWGREGKSYSNTCPAKFESPFLSGYSKGKLEYDQLQIQKTQVDALVKLAEPKPIIIQHGQQMPAIPPKGCFSSFDCEIKDKCIQDPQSRFSTDRICQKRPGKKCFSDWDCEIKGSCEDKLCKFDLK